MGYKYDLTNQEFGRWKVLEYAGTNKNRESTWLCECSCPAKTRKVVVGRSLRNGLSKSCGCLKAERMSIDLTNKRFGKLVAQYPTDKRVNHHVVWHCICDCGGWIETASDNLVSGNTQSCGCVHTSLGEDKIKQILLDNNINFVQEKTFEDCKFEKSNYLARFDFYINDNYLIEFDGEQHFNCRKNGWHTEEKLIEIQDRDKQKNQYCLEHNIPLIRIPYWYLNDIKLADLMLETSEFIVKSENVAETIDSIVS